MDEHFHKVHQKERIISPAHKRVKSKVMDKGQGKSPKVRPKPTVETASDPFLEMSEPDISLDFPEFPPHNELPSNLRSLFPSPEKKKTDAKSATKKDDNSRHSPNTQIHKGSDSVAATAVIERTKITALAESSQSSPAKHIDEKGMAGEVRLSTPVPSGSPQKVAKVSPTKAVRALWTRNIHRSAAAKSISRPGRAYVLKEVEISGAPQGRTYDHRQANITADLSDPRVTFLAAPSSYRIHPAAKILQRARYQAQRARRMYNQVPVGFISVRRIERAILPNGTVYQMETSYVRDPTFMMQEEKSTQTGQASTIEQEVQTDAVDKPAEVKTKDQETQANSLW